MQTKPLFLLLVAATAFAATFGCSTAAPKKYVFFGEPQPQQVDIFEDFWSDEPCVFKPDDPELPLRRGKGAVVRFFKKGSYSKSILVDGTLTVNVYDGVDEGIEMTQPDARLVVTSEELNEKYRKFDKKIGYTYNIWLDLGEYDQPEKEITILSVFKDEKTGQATLSKPIRTIAPGTTPLPKKDDETLSAAERWAQKKLGGKSSDPLGDLQRRYSARNAARSADEERRSKTRVRDTIDVDAAQLRSNDDADDDFEFDGDFESDETSANGVRDGRNVQKVSLLQEAQDRRDATLAQFMEENREKREYYREKRRAETEEYRADADSRFERANGLNAFNEINGERGATNALNFRDLRPDYRAETSDFAARANGLADRLSAEAERTEERRAYESAVDRRADAPTSLGYDAETVADATRRADENRRAARSSRASVYASPSAAFEAETPRPVRTPAASFDGLDDFQPAADAPTKEVYVGRPSSKN